MAVTTQEVQKQAQPAQQPERRYMPSINPATREEIGRVPLMTEEEIKAAMNAAQSAFPKWAALPLEERLDYMNRAKQYILDHFDEIARTISDEQGKPRMEAVSADIFTVVDMITYYAKNAPKWLRDEEIPLHLMKFPKFKRSKFVYEPLGVVAVIAPWNFPFAIPMSGLVCAMLTGNTVVFKPASEVPFIAKKIEDAFVKGAKLPEGVFNLILAKGSTVGKVLFNPPIKKVVFTGSTDIGKVIMEECSRHFIPVVLELGGKDPMIVLDDADQELAAKGAVWGAFTNCGQVCASVERLYVDEKIADGFIKRVVEETKKIRIGRDVNGDVDMGPLVNEEQRRIVEEHVADAVAKGAKIVHGGNRRDDLGGFFYEPTVFVNANHDMIGVREETFGPTLPIMTFKTEEEAIRLANDSIFGLTASVWSRDKARAEKVARKLEAGSITINDHAYTYGVVDTPWQGVKESGVGRSHAKLGLMEFVFPKHINIDYFPDSMKKRPWWYPYSMSGYELFKNGAKALFGSYGIGEKIGCAIRALKNGKSILK